MARFGAAVPSESQNEAQKNKIFRAPASSATGKAPKHQILSLLQMQARWMRKKKPTQPLKSQHVVGGCRKQSGGSKL